MKRIIFNQFILLFIAVISLITTSRAFAAQSAFSPILASKYSSMSGVQAVNQNGLNYVGYIDQGDSIVYNDVNFGDGAVVFSATVAVPKSNAGQKIELRVDKINGPLLGVFIPRATGGWETFKTQKMRIRKVTGTRPLYLVAKSRKGKDGWGIVNIQSFVFSQAKNQTQVPMPMPMPQPQMPTPTTTTTMPSVTTTTMASSIPPEIIKNPSSGNGDSFDQVEVGTPTTTTMPPAPISEKARGAALYTTNCSICHGALTTSQKLGATPMRINTGIMTILPMMGFSTKLTQADINAISIALGGMKDPAAGSTVGGSSGDVVKSEPGQACDNKVPGFVNIRRLSNYEYDNVMRDLFGITVRSSDKYKFPADSYGLFYSNTAAPQGIDMTLMQAYVNAASGIIDEVLSTKRQTVVTCSGTNDVSYRECASKTVNEFGYKAFRRPLTNAEITQFMSLYDQTKSMASGLSAAQAFDESLKAPLQAMLVSPQFLYVMIDRSSVQASAAKSLNAYELASRLSFFIWGSIPDQTLMSLAANGTLTSKDVLQQQVDRMLKDPKSVYMIDVFAAQWLKLERFANRQIKPDPGVFPEFSETLRDSMMTETRMLLADVIQRDASPYLLINADYTYMNKALSTHYGIAGATSNQFTKVSLANTSRVGIITHGSVLTANSKANESSIVIRGVWALDRLLCAPPGMPPKNVDKNLPKSTEGMNPQQRLAAHTANASCAACHNRIDPIGISLEVFDGDGKLRSKYPNGDAINTQGQFPPPSNASFGNAKQMAEALSTTGTYRMCVSRHLLSFSLGRDLTESDVCAADTIGQMVVTPQSKFSDLVKAVVTSEQFMKQAGGN